MDRPWFQFWARDWLDNKELGRCTPGSRAVLADLMCLAHEGTPYGYLADKIGPLTDKYMAGRCRVTLGAFKSAVRELLTAERIQQSELGLFVPRMVRDEEIRIARASGGIKGGNPKLMVPQKVNLPSALEVGPEVDSISRARMRADSDYDSSNLGGDARGTVDSFDAERFVRALSSQHPCGKCDIGAVERYMPELVRHPKFDGALVLRRHEAYVSGLNDPQYAKLLSNWLASGLWLDPKLDGQPPVNPTEGGWSGHPD